MECGKCGHKRNARLMSLPTMFCKCGGFFQPPRKTKPPDPDDPATEAYRQRFEDYLDSQEKQRPWNRWTGSIYTGRLIKETPKAIRVSFENEPEPKWIPKSVIDLELGAGRNVDVWIPDWLMAVPNDELLELLEAEEWTIPEAWIPK